MKDVLSFPTLVFVQTTSDKKSRVFCEACFQHFDTIERSADLDNVASGKLARARSPAEIKLHCKCVIIMF